MKSVSLPSSAYNDAGTIEHGDRCRYDAALLTDDYEIIVINDGSSDHRRGLGGVEAELSRLGGTPPEEPGIWWGFT